jgi:murein DD-endopeptidase MepM/ murein hydrolase activator NlpD
MQSDGYVTLYAHLRHHTIERGDQVVLGQEIAAVGSTGASIRPHLHYEVLKEGVAVDPLALR